VSNKPILLAAAALLGACAPPLPPAAPPVTPVPPAPAPTPRAAALPAVPVVDGPLEIRVVHPSPGMARPTAASTQIYGSVGSGRASLEINGHPVYVEPNGAFLAFLPVPADGNWRLTARREGEVVHAWVSYRTPAPAAVAAAPAALRAFAVPLAATVATGADTLATGSQVAIGRPTPTGPYRWFLPRGARLRATAEQGTMVRVLLSEGVEAWFPRERLTLGPEAPVASVAPVGSVRVSGAPEAPFFEVTLPVEGRPFRIEGEARLLRVMVYQATPPAGEAEGTHPALREVRWAAERPDVARLELATAETLWGYKAWYREDGALVLRVRRPPPIDPSAPLRGVRILVDAGHPPAGTTGPTGLTEADANLAISLRLAERLRARGAEVVMTRTDERPLVSATDAAAELGARVELAVRSDAHLLVSVHNNAFPEGVDPFRRHGTSTYVFHGHALPFGMALNREIVAVTGIPDLGTLQGNFAVVRPTWMPSALTESLFMPIPQQEAALRDPGFLDRLADAHVAGIERHLRGVTGR
jgi:N-acetylmuramoyl-L-alanine amidase